MRRTHITGIWLAFASAVVWAGALVWVSAAATVPAGAASTLPASALAVGPVSGLPVPRFVSLKPDKVNVRAGPKRDHHVSWQYQRAGLPVEITAESDNWRRIRDWEGAEGWVYHTLLSGRRTAMVMTRGKNELVALHASADANSAVTARLQAHVLGAVKECDGNWCRIVGADFGGWIAQDHLWGVYPNEKIE
jgi:SH3-like domain-containing protein